MSDEVSVEALQARLADSSTALAAAQAQAENLATKLQRCEAQLQELHGERDRYRPHQELLEAVTSRVLAAILVLDGRDLRARWANPACANMLDEPYRSQLDIVGLRVDEFLPGAEQIGLLDTLRQAAATCQVVSDFESEYAGFGRGTTYWRWSIVPLQTGGETRPDLLLVAYDVTEQVGIRRQMEAANAELADELAHTQQLQRISTQLIQEGRTEALYEQILEAAIALLHSDMGCIHVLDPARNELRLLTCRGLHPASADFWQWVSTVSSSAPGVALATGEQVVVPDTEACDFLTGRDDLINYRLSNIRALQSTPLLSRNGALVGMISTHWYAPHRPAERDLRLLDLLARQAADLIERTRAEETLRQAQNELEQRVQERTQELAASREELRGYARRLVEEIEKERQTIARELHDEAGQALTAIMLGLGLVERECRHSSEHLVEPIQELKRTTDEVMVNLHRLSRRLRPASLDRLGLVAALRQHIQTFEEQQHIDISFYPINLDDGHERLPGEIESTVYRVVQEALTNVARHAHAKHVGVVLKRKAHRVVAIVEDDGRGFDPNAVAQCGRLGLVGMRERAELMDGRLDIESAPGRGTTVFLDLPVALQSSAAPEDKDEDQARLTRPGFR